MAGKVSFFPFCVFFGYYNEKGTLKTSKNECYTGSINLNGRYFVEWLRNVKLENKGIDIQDKSGI